MKMNMKRRLLLAVSAIAVLLQATAGASVQAESNTSLNTPPPGWEGLIPITEPQYPPFTVMEGFPGPISFPEPPLVEKDVLLVPARALLERLGYSVGWDDAEKAVIAEKQGMSLHFPIAQSEAVVNGIKKRLPTPARLEGALAYIPLRFTAEADNREVIWRSYNKQVVVRESGSLAQVKVISVVEAPLPEEQMKELALKVGAYSGLQLKLTSLGKDNYQQKVNLLIASGDLPEMLLIPDPFFLQASMMYSVFWDLKPFLSDYPHLSLAVDRLGNQVVLNDGGVYGIPRLQNAYDGTFPAIRQDWLDRLGYMMPATMDELYNVLLAFEAKDPDGNGKRDTIALTGSPGRNDLDNLAWVENVFNESGGRFKLTNDTVKDTWMDAGTKDALKWLNKAYAAGFLAKDFPVSSAEHAKRLVTEDHAGVMAMTGTEAAHITEQMITKINYAQLVPIPYLQAKTGGIRIVPASVGHSGVFAISKSVSETKVRRILDLMEAWMSAGEQSATERETLKPLEPYFGNASAADLTSVQKQREQIGSAQLQDPTLGLFSNEMRARLYEADKKLYETKIKIILGALPIDNWDSVVEQVKKDADYQSVMKELNEKWVSKVK